MAFLPGLRLPASPCLAPWGGCEPLLGNNPFAVAIPPVEKSFPLFLDIAQSVVSGGKLRLFEKQGKTKIPRGWAMDKEGRTTEDIEEAVGNMLLMPGEIEFETEIKRKKEGITIPCAVVDGLNRLAESLNSPARL